MFAGDVSLRSANEPIAMEPWMLAELRKCANDPVYFANNYVKITTKDNGIQLFKTWDFQADFIRTLKDNRFVTAKWARQVGKCCSFEQYVTVKFSDNTTETLKIGDLFELLKRMHNGDK